MKNLTRIRGIGPVFASRIAEIGVNDIASLAAADPAILVSIRGITIARAESFCAEAKALGAALPKAGKKAKEAKNKDKKKSRKKELEKFEKELKKASKKATKKAAKKARKKTKKSGGKKSS